MQNLSVDLGASTIDVIEWTFDSVKRKFLHYKLLGSFEYENDFDVNLHYFLNEQKINASSYDRIFVTGGKSRGFQNENYSIINEIDAIGRGGEFLVRDQLEDDFVVVSLGTGTCIVHVKDGKVSHLGGTGVGGGTFLALSRELFGVVDLLELQSLYEKGDRDKVDLSVKEVIGGGIGIVSEDVTASNLGKIAREVDFTKEDLAAGIVNLIGQTIATAACFAAKSVASSTIVLTGKLTRIKAIVDVIKKAGAVYGIKVILPRDADYVSAIGAGVFF